jgi:predicted ATPase
MSEGLANLQQGLSAGREIGQKSNETFGLALLAEAGAADGDRLAVLSEALDVAAETGERFFEADLLRQRGMCLLQHEDEQAAEVSFQQALNIARRQEAKSLELRAATSLALLWKNQGETEKARTLLAEVVGWFTEGFETRDLQEARMFLAQLDDCDSNCLPVSVKQPILP